MYMNNLKNIFIDLKLSFKAGKFSRACLCLILMKLSVKSFVGEFIINSNKR